MKRRALIGRLQEHGCIMVREGGSDYRSHCVPLLPVEGLLRLISEGRARRRVQFSWRESRF